jgi:hypothetical protein
MMDTLCEDEAGSKSIRRSRTGRSIIVFKERLAARGIRFVSAWLELRHRFVRLAMTLLEPDFNIASDDLHTSCSGSVLLCLMGEANYGGE